MSQTTLQNADASDGANDGERCEYCETPIPGAPGVVVVEAFRELAFCDRACHEPWAAGDR